MVWACTPPVIFQLMGEALLLAVSSFNVQRISKLIFVLYLYFLNVIFFLSNMILFGFKAFSVGIYYKDDTSMRFLFLMYNFS